MKRQVDIAHPAAAERPNQDVGAPAPRVRNRVHGPLLRGSAGRSGRTRSHAARGPNLDAACVASREDFISGDSPDARETDLLVVLDRDVIELRGPSSRKCVYEDAAPGDRV